MDHTRRRSAHLQTLIIEKDTSIADLHPFAENLFIVDGPPVRDMGLMFTTRMTVVKLRGGKAARWFIVGEFSCLCIVRYAETDYRTGAGQTSSCRDPETCLAARGVAQPNFPKQSYGQRGLPH
jgi:hypothetical protein